MFFETKDKLPRGLLKSCVVPRPIAWVTTVNQNKSINIAPFSYFNAVCDNPPTLMISIAPKNSKNELKDTAFNIENNKEFVVNIVSFEAKDLMNKTSSELPYNISEAESFNIETKNSKLISTPSIKNSPINIECKHLKTVEIGNVNHPNKVIFGEILGINIEESILTNNQIDINKLNPLSRLGGDYYSAIKEFFEMKRD